MLNDDESTPKDKGYGWGPKCGNYWINQIFERDATYKSMATADLNTLA
ncbi:hypothetical protein HanXRQr2_Chr06g0249071 [Helianthus annuus]|uniref:Uncharacterized protein n=1 Tax=Helianthus annuus TaxID=4232 RepID=A0A9K3IRN3_HELAN|nr:hypothetical protein HanXRQr2_Chr06g0249071 [Helianthus annuus]